MNTMTMTPQPEAGLAQGLFDLLKSRRRRIGPLASIIVLHLVAGYLLQSGLLSKAVRATLPEVINISFVAPPAPPQPSPPAMPKTVEVAAPQPRIIVPPLPLLAVAPAEAAITQPQAPAESAPVAAVAAPPAPAAAAPVPAPATPRTVSSVEYIKAPQPVYPNVSRRLGETGTVILRILISEKGLPEQVTIQQSSGFVNLDEAGRLAALRALFKPLIENGKAVSVFVIVPLNFQLS